MFGKLLFFFVFPKLGISYKVKKSLINQGFKGTFHMNRILKNCGVNFERRE